MLPQFPTEEPTSPPPSTDSNYQNLVRKVGKDHIRNMVLEMNNIFPQVCLDTIYRSVMESNLDENEAIERILRYEEEDEQQSLDHSDLSSEDEDNLECCMQCSNEQHFPCPCDVFEIFLENLNDSMICETFQKCPNCSVSGNQSMK